MVDLKEYLEYRRKSNNFNNYVGLWISDMQPGYSAGELTVREELYNSHEGVHGGCLFTLADTIAGAAAASTGILTTTVDSNFYFLRACSGVDKIYAEGRVIKKGKTLVVCEIEITDGKDIVFAKGTFTYYNLGEAHIPDDWSAE